MRIGVVTFPGSLDDRDASIRIDALAAGFVPESLRPVIRKLNGFAKLFSKEPVATVMPFDLRIH